jgi:hypothetical protein
VNHSPGIATGTDYCDEPVVDTDKKVNGPENNA